MSLLLTRPPVLTRPLGRPRAHPSRLREALNFVDEDEHEARGVVEQLVDARKQARHLRACMHVSMRVESRPCDV